MAPTLEEVAKKFQNLKVARIDGDKYLEIQLQFLIGGFPSIYHIKDGEVRLYSEGYKYEQFETYLKGGWKSKEPLPYYKSPISLAGKGLKVLGLITRITLDFSSIFTEKYGIPLVGVLVGLGIFGVVIIILLLVLIDRIFPAASPKKIVSDSPPSSSHSNQQSSSKKEEKEDNKKQSPSQEKAKSKKKKKTEKE